MKLKVSVALVTIALTGCAASPENRLSWDMKPVMNVRHGMADAMAYYQIGRTRQAQGHLPGAEAAYQKALAIDPENIDAMNALGAMYAERGDLERAAAIYKRVADLSPQRAYLHNNIGYALFLQGKHAEAIDAFRQAVTIDPAYERAWVNLQKVALKAGKPELAALAAQRSLRQSGEPVTQFASAVPSSSTVAVNPNSAQEMKLQLADGLPALAGSNVADSNADLPQNKVAAADGPNTAIRMSEVSARVLPAAAFAKVLKPSEVRETAVPGHEPSPAALIKVSTHAVASPATAPIPGARLEVSNGNGVNGLASRVRARLKGDGVSVSRLTNFATFNVQLTTIEYREGFVDAALALKERLGGKSAILKKTKLDRPGTDVRLILGMDWQAPYRVLSELQPDLDSSLASLDVDGVGDSAS